MKHLFVHFLFLVVLSACTAGSFPTSATAETAAHVQMDQAMVIDGVIQGNNLTPLRTALLEKKAGDVVDLVINSPGGSVSAGFDFVSVMEDARARNVRINCYVASMAASMAFQILLHCDERHVLDRSLLLWHRARIMLGGMGNSTMTSPQLEVLGRSLDSMDSVIFSECKAAIRMEEAVLRYHFENETMHIGSQLSASTGSFQSHAAISGLFEALANKKIPRTIPIASFFDFSGGGSTGPTVPWRTDLNGFTPGEIIYIK